MTDQQNDIDELYIGLRALSESAFPKKCSGCGRLFQSAEDFIRRSQTIDGGSGLKSSIGEQEETIVELFRNCVCGSTLLDFFSERRDASPQGLKRREIFGRILQLLIAKGVPAATGRTELLRFMRGKHSKLLENHGIRMKGRTSE
jgi:hypothetical protein